MNNNTIATNIKSARRSARITQQQLAAAVGVQQPIISRYEKGDVIPSADVYLRIMEVCGFAVSFSRNVAKNAKK